jgi:dihydrodipicolinate synthase/N-acetylneuraminate lyase
MPKARHSAFDIAGVIPILATPFDQRGNVVEGDFVRAIDASLSDRVDGLAMFGLASEAYKLSDDEKRCLSTLLIEHVGGRRPVVISVTHQSTELAVHEAAWAEQAGADAIMVMPPLIGSLGEAAVRNHITAVAEAVELPVIVQYAPLQTGASLSPDNLSAIHLSHRNVTHVKVDAVPSGPLITRLQTCSQMGLRSLVGYMGLHLPDDMRRGVSGVMPTVSLGKGFVHLYQLLRAGSEEGRTFHHKLLPLLNFMMQSVEMLIAVEKELLVRRGIFRSARYREPGWTMDAFQRAELEQYVADLGEWIGLTPTNEEYPA